MYSKIKKHLCDIGEEFKREFSKELKRLYYEELLGKEVPLYDFNSNDIEDILKIIYLEKKIYLDRRDEKIFPNIINKKEYEWGIKFVILLPVGLSYELFYKNEDTFETALDKEIKIEHKGKRIYLTVYTKKLKSKYLYNDNVLNKLKEIKFGMPIGYSKEGFIYINFTKTYHHLLVGGMMGSGKSVFIRQGLYSMCKVYPVDYFEIYFIDLKGGLEVKPFSNVPHVKGIAKNKLQSKELLEELDEELKRRMAIIGDEYVENINDLSIEKRKELNLPYILLVVDEFAELTTGIDMIEKFGRLCRFAGMHMIIATQRPDRQTVDGKIKANIPATVAFRVRNRINSQILLDNDKASYLPDIEGRAILQSKHDNVIQVPLLRTKKLYKEYGYPKPDIKPIVERVKDSNENEVVGKVYED